MKTVRNKTNNLVRLKTHNKSLFELTIN